jgi:hypothetical protein
LVAFIVGAVLYFVLAKAGLEPPVVEMAAAAPQPVGEAPEAPAAPQVAATEEALGGPDTEKKDK